MPEEERPPPPEVPDWLNWVWRAWAKLDDERGHSVSGFAAPLGAMKITSKPRRIPWSKMDLWCRRRRYNAAQQSFLEECLKAMDSEYLAWWQERQAS